MIGIFVSVPIKALIISLLYKHCKNNDCNNFVSVPIKALIIPLPVPIVLPVYGEITVMNGVSP